MYITNLPAHWKVGRFGELGNLVRGVTYKRHETTDTSSPGYLPILRATNIQDRQLLLEEELVYVKGEKVSDLQLLRRGDVIIAMSSGSKSVVGKSVQLNTEWKGSFGAFCAVFRHNSTVEPFFIGHIFQTKRYREHLLREARGTNINNLSKNHILDYQFPLPPLPEQRAIAHILQTIQGAKAARQHELTLERERKAALMDYLFSYGTKDEPRKQTEIGEIPESWEVVELEFLIDVKHGYAFKSEYFTESGDIVLTPGNFLVTGGLYWGAKTKFTSQKYPADFLFEPGDLVVVMTDLTPSTKLLGASAFIPKGKRVLHNQRIGKILLKSRLASKDFLYWLFNSKAFRKHMALTATGSTVRHTSPSRIKNYKFGLPLNGEQQKIAQILQAFDTKIAALEQEAERLDELFHAMLDELMTGKRSAVPLIDAE